MNATIGLLAYGLRPSPLSSGAPTWLLAAGTPSMASWELQMVAAHAGCHISAFCRNPLHPGPCKGWKHHLGLVSPGALHALEKVRHDQLESKRQAKVKALKEAGKAIPKSLQTPIVYDPAKNKHLQQPDKITPGLGIPTKGLTPEAAKKTLEAIPTKAQVGAKLDAKHAAQDAASAKALENVKAIIAGKHNGAPLSTIVGALMKLSKAQYDGLSQEDKQKVVSRIFLHHGSMVTHAGKPFMAGMPADAADNLAKKYEELTGKPISDHAEVWKSLASPQQLDFLAKEAAAALPKPTQAPIYTTIGKAGLKPGDKVFLHGKGKATGEPQLVTVRKLAGDYAKGYEFEDEQGNMLPHAGGVASKWLLSPAPGKSFPDHTPASPDAGPSPFEKGEKTKMDNLAKAALDQDKANGQAHALGRIANLTNGKTIGEKDLADLAAHAHAKNQAGEPPLDPEVVDIAAKKIAAKVYPVGGNAALMHQGDLEEALKKDLHEGVMEGKPTPVVDAAKKAGVSLGQGEPGAAQALADAVHAKLGISGKDDTPALITTPPAVANHEAKLSAVDVGHSSLIDHIDSVDEIEPDEYQALKPKAQQKVKDILDHLEGLGDSKPGLSKEAAKVKDKLGIPHNHEPLGHAQADAFHEPAAFGSPNASAAPHVKAAIAYANGHQAATDTNKLAAYQKLSPEELAALDPNTQKLMAANLAGMQKKFLAKSKQDAAANVLKKLQVAQGGGAGAGGSSHVAAPAATAAKVKLGASAALTYNHLGGATDHKDVYSPALQSAHDNGNIDQLAEVLGGAMADKALAALPVGVSDEVKGIIHPHLAAEMASGLKGEQKPAPLVAGLLQTKTSGDVSHFVDATMAHPSTGPALSKKSDLKENAIKLGAHAGQKPTFANGYEQMVDDYGQEGTHSGLASMFTAAKVNHLLHNLDLGPEEEGNLKAGVGSLISTTLSKDYEDALNAGKPVPDGLAGGIDKIVTDTNLKGAELATKNGWPQDSPAVKAWKTAYFSNAVKDLATSSHAQAGAGGTSSHTPPHVAPPAAHTVPSYAAPSATPAGVKKIIELKHAKALKVVSLMKSFPEGQYLESPEPKIWDNLVAISAHEGVTPMQALSTLDEQNAKKLGLTNKKLLEAKIRDWLGTADGKQYAAANGTPKAHLLDHIKSKESGSANFTNNTGIALPPGEKVQKIGGPGEHDENKPDSDFGKHDIATAEADQTRFKKDQGIKFSAAQKAALREYVEGSGNINGWLRDEHTPPQKSIDNTILLQSMMLPTTRDHLLLRGTGWSQFPPEARSFEGLQKLIGETLEEPAFLSASVSKSSSGFGGTVKMHIQAPKGTMGVFTKDNQFPNGVVPSFLNNEAELLLAAKTELKVLKVWKEGGQVQVLMRVVS